MSSIALKAHALEKCLPFTMQSCSVCSGWAFGTPCLQCSGTHVVFSLAGVVVMALSVQSGTFLGQ
jgi:hypothetical protein